MDWIHLAQDVDLVSLKTKILCRPMTPTGHAPWRQLIYLWTTAGKQFPAVYKSYGLGLGSQVGTSLVTCVMSPFFQCYVIPWKYQ
jgi:hypothetical protein